MSAWRRMATLVIVASTPALAQAPRDTTAATGATRQLTAYYAVPEIPATSILGVASTTVTRPVTQKDFTSGLVNAIDQTGKVKQGFAMEGTLGLLAPFRVTLSQYQADALARFWSNVAVSLATTQASGDTSSTDVGWGVRAPIFDDGDALAKTAYTDRLAGALRECLPARPPAGVPGANEAPSPAFLAAKKASETQILACLDRAAQEIGKQAADTFWNVRRLVVGYAGSMRLGQSAITQRQLLGNRVWASGSMPLSVIMGSVPFGRAVQAIGYFDYWRRQRIDSVAAYSTMSYGGRLNAGSSRFNGFYEIVGEHRSGQPRGASSNGSSWSGGVEFLAAQGVWISTGLGKRALNLLKPNNTVVIANIRWGVAGKSFLAPQSQ